MDKIWIVQVEGDEPFAVRTEEGARRAYGRIVLELVQSDPSLTQEAAETYVTYYEIDFIDQ